LQQLSWKLQKRLASGQDAVQNQTSTLLKPHQTVSNLLSEAALHTTKAGMAQQRLLREGPNIKLFKARRNSLKSVLQKLASKTFKKIRWLMWWPLNSACLLCVLMAAPERSWPTIHNAPLKALQVLADQQINFKRLSNQFCNSLAGKKQCTSNH
jgi:hypothetical protein